MVAARFHFDLGIVKVQELVPFGFGVIAQLLFHFEETRIREGRPVIAADVERGKNDRNPRRATCFCQAAHRRRSLRRERAHRASCRAGT